MSCIRTRGLSTPHMDELARTGTILCRAYSTCASCSPSRSSILTGMYPHSNGHWRNTVAPGLNDPPEAWGRRSTKLDSVGVHEDVPTLIELLNNNGYVTGIMQKFHLSPSVYSDPFFTEDSEDSKEDIYPLLYRSGKHANRRIHCPKHIVLIPCLDLGRIR